MESQNEVTVSWMRADVGDLAIGAEEGLQGPDQSGGDRKNVCMTSCENESC